MYPSLTTGTFCTTGVCLDGAHGVQGHVLLLRWWLHGALAWVGPPAPGASPGNGMDGRFDNSSSRTRNDSRFHRSQYMRRVCTSWSRGRKILAPYPWRRTPNPAAGNIQSEQGPCCCGRQRRGSEWEHRAAVSSAGPRAPLARFSGHPVRQRPGQRGRAAARRTNLFADPFHSSK